MAYIGVQPTDTYLSIASQQITGTGSATYTLDYSVSNEEDVAVFVNNVRQNVSTYTVSGTSLTLGGTISASDSCWVLFLGRTVGTKTPAVGSVTNDMLAGSIANSKLANSSITLNGSAVSLGGSATVGGSNTPSFSAYGTTQSMTSGTNTQVVFGSENFDTDNAFASNTFTVPSGEGGKYYFVTSLCLDNREPTRYSLSMRVNNVEKNLLELGKTGSYSGIQTSAIFNLSAGDTVNVYFYHNYGSAVSTYAGEARQFFKGFKLI